MKKLILAVALLFACSTVSFAQGSAPTEGLDSPKIEKKVVKKSTKTRKATPHKKVKKHKAPVKPSTELR
ncbi:MAG: hypothetical protein WCQ99_01905 [Pseudomonadota bacterium]